MGRAWEVRAYIYNLGFGVLYFSVFLVLNSYERYLYLKSIYFFVQGLLQSRVTACESRTQTRLFPLTTLELPYFVLTGVRGLR